MDFQLIIHDTYKVVPQFVSVQLVYKYYFTRVDGGYIELVLGIMFTHVHITGVS